MRSTDISQKRVLSIAPTVKVHLFGSVARGKLAAASDVGILVILENLKGVDVDALKARIKSRYRSYPIELHVIRRRT